MKRLVQLGMGVGATVALSLPLAAVAGAQAPWCPPGGPPGARDAVFVQTDGLSGNQVVAYNRAPNGTLTPGATYNTGGLGGQLTGSVVDHVASEGSLAYNAEQGLLYAVNAGSNSVSVFAVHGASLSLTQVISSGGSFPVSVAVHGNLVYVLNAESGGSIQGYYSNNGHLTAVPWSNRNLGLTIPTGATQFVNTPGQVAFSPNGSQLIVTTKANGSDIDVFGVGRFGQPSATPVVNAEPGAVPFGITFDRAGHLVIANAGSESVSTYWLSPSGTLASIDSVPTGATATCWITGAGAYLYASNAGSGTETGLSDSAGGQLGLLGATATDAGTVDASATPGGQFLYIQAGGSGIVDEFVVNANGTLSEVGSVTVPNAVGGEGIVAS